MSDADFPPRATALGQPRPRIRNAAAWLLPAPSSRAAETLAGFVRSAAEGRCWRLPRRQLDRELGDVGLSKAVVRGGAHGRLLMSESSCDPRPEFGGLAVTPSRVCTSELHDLIVGPPGKEPCGNVVVRLCRALLGPVAAAVNTEEEQPARPQNTGD